jgi:hypothetical protein
MSTTFKYEARVLLLENNQTRVREDLKFQINNTVDLHNGTRYTIQNNSQTEIVLDDQANVILITSTQPVKVVTDSDDTDNLVQFSVDTASDMVNTALDVFPYTTQPFTLTTEGTLPAPLSTDTTYYAISYSTNQFLIASSASDAQSGTQIDITSIGTGVSRVQFLDSYDRGIREQAQSKQFLLTDVNAKRITIINDSGAPTSVKLYAYRTAT